MLDSRIDHSLSPTSALAIVAALALATIPIAGLAARSTSIPPWTLRSRRHRVRFSAAGRGGGHVTVGHRARCRRQDRA